MIGNIPVVMLINKLGVRRVFTALGLLSGLATLVMPLAIRHAFSCMLVCRALQGLAFAANFPVIGAVASRWSYFKQVFLKLYLAVY